MRGAPVSDVAEEQVVLAAGRPVGDVGAGSTRSIVGAGLDGVLVQTPALADTFPDLRRRDPAPVVPWHVRARRWWRERTHAGKVETAHDAALAVLTARLATGTHVVGVISPKGGVGKTSLALALGQVLAHYPLARPALVELNPDWGNARRLLGRPNPRTVADLLADYTAVDRAGVGLLQGYVTMWGRLPVLTAPADPDAMAALAPRDYDRALRLLTRHYAVVLLDCGTGFGDRLTQYALQRADHLLVVSDPDPGTALTCLEAMRYLASARYAATYRGALDDLAGAGDGEEMPAVRARGLDRLTLVLNKVGVCGEGEPADLTLVREAAPDCNAVVSVPYSAPFKARLADSTLTPDNLPAPVRRAAKAALVAVLARLADR